MWGEKRKKGRKKEKTVSKLLLRISYWVEMQELCVFVMLLFGKILGSWRSLCYLQTQGKHYVIKVLSNRKC